MIVKQSDINQAVIGTKYPTVQPTAAFYLSSGGQTSHHSRRGSAYYFTSSLCRSGPLYTFSPSPEPCHGQLSTHVAHPFLTVVVQESIIRKHKKESTILGINNYHITTVLQQSLQSPTSDRTLLLPTTLPQSTKETKKHEPLCKVFH